MEIINKSRETIDFIDNNILVLLKERFEIVKTIKEIKKKNNINIFDSKREDKIYCNIYKNFPEYYLYFKPIYESILNESKNYQKMKLRVAYV